MMVGKRHALASHAKAISTGFLLPTPQNVAPLACSMDFSACTHFGKVKLLSSWYSGRLISISTRISVRMDDLSGSLWVLGGAYRTEIDGRRMESTRKQLLLGLVAHHLPSRLHPSYLYPTEHTNMDQEHQCAHERLGPNRSLISSAGNRSP